jgi:hypothetical protein
MQTAKVEQLKKGETTHSWSEEVRPLTAPHLLLLRLLAPHTRTTTLRASTVRESSVCES